MASGKINPGPKIPDAGQSDPGNVTYSPWDTRHENYDRTRHDWIVKNVFGNKNPFVKDQTSGWMVGDKGLYNNTLRRYVKGYDQYDAYLKEIQDNLDNPTGPTDPNAGQPPPTSGSGRPPPLWGKYPDPPGPARTPENMKFQRLGSMTPYQFGDRRQAPGAAAQSGMRVAPRNQWSDSQVAGAINKWNEFQQNRAKAWAKAPQNQNTGMSQRGAPVQSRTNLLPQQAPGLRQQVWGAQGGNLNSALMGASAPYQGPKG